MHRTLIILALLAFSSLLFGQEEKTFRYYDTTTYSQYLKQDWKRLKTTGREALKSGHDYYYLRMRLGIAFYEKQQYRSAIAQFRHALGFNPGDRVALEYLYFSYLMSGRQADLNALVPHMPMSFRVENLLDRPAGVTNVSLGYQYSMNQEDQIQDLYQKPVLAISGEGMQYITRHYNYFNAGLGHQLSPGIQLQHMLSFISKTDLYYYNDLSSEYFVPDRQTSQYQYYLLGRFFLYPGGVLYPSFQIVYVKSPAYYQRQGFGSSSLAAPEFISNDLVLNLAYSQEAGPFTIEISATYSYINRMNNLQQNAQLVWYPLGNLNLYSVTGASRISELVGNRFDEERYVFREKLGARIARPLWMEIFAYSGNFRNYSDNYGVSVFNSLDFLKNLAGVNLIILPAKKTRLQISYSRSLLISNYDTYPLITSDEVNQYRYFVHSINGGIQWNF